MMNFFGDPSFDNPFDFIVLPNTGLQICRGFSLQDVSPEAYQWAWEAACRNGESCKDDENVKLLTKYLAVNQEVENSGWIVVDGQDMIYFRMTRASEDAKPELDIVVDTRLTAGRTVGNVIPELVGRRLFEKTAAQIFVEDPDKAGGVRGELIIDFGNSGITAVWFPAGDAPGSEKILEINEPFDPEWRKRPDKARSIPSSCNALIKVLGNDPVDPWVVMGKRAEDYLNAHPKCTYQFSPKKYVRFWPEHLKPLEPATAIKGEVGQRQGLHRKLVVVGMGIRNLLSNVLSAIVNPNYAASEPSVYPKVDSIMLTHPLTWRESDRGVFRKLFEESAAKYLHGGGNGDGTKVELICSEPVAVAAYFLWESIFYYRLDALDFMAGAWGKTVSEPSLRLLVLDIGGGSTDIAVVEASWEQGEDGTVDVRFKMIETMRFNRAGDRLTHLIVTALRAFMCKKHEVPKCLSFDKEAQDPNFSLANKRSVVSRLFDLAEKAKRHLSENEKPFVLRPEDEMGLLYDYGPVAAEQATEANVSQRPRFRLTPGKLERWVRRDRQRLENNGQSGFMDIFNFLGELGDALKEREGNKFPHLAVLSGRSTRLPLIKELVVEKLGIPAHRVRTLKQLLPLTVNKPGHENPDKISVVIGANRFRSGDNVQFIPVPEEKIFKRFIGAVIETPEGNALNSKQILARPGDYCPRTCTIKVPPAGNVRLGHAFRETTSAQVIAVLSNDTNEEKAVTIDLIDDYEVKLHKPSGHKTVVTPSDLQDSPEPGEPGSPPAGDSPSSAESDGVSLREWVPGGDDVIVDNFNDTGEIDCEPSDFIQRHIIDDDSPKRNAERFSTCEECDMETDCVKAGECLLEEEY